MSCTSRHYGTYLICIRCLTSLKKGNYLCDLKLIWSSWMLTVAFGLFWKSFDTSLSKHVIPEHHPVANHVPCVLFCLLVFNIQHINYIIIGRTLKLLGSDTQTMYLLAGCFFILLFRHAFISYSDLNLCIQPHSFHSKTCEIPAFHTVISFHLYLSLQDFNTAEHL